MGQGSCQHSDVSARLVFSRRSCFPLQHRSGRDRSAEVSFASLATPSLRMTDLASYLDIAYA